MIREEWRTVEWHSREWDELTEQGWTTVTTDNGRAVMLRQWEGGRILSSRPRPTHAHGGYAPRQSWI